MLKQAAHPSGTHLFLVVDADYFKRINDVHGHACGDEALKLIADALRNAVRGYDIVGRIGGEEFAMLLPYVKNEDAHYIADRLCRAVASVEFKPHRERYDLTVSVGGVVYYEAMPFSELFRAADANLYAAKDQGRNGAVVTDFGEHCTPRQELELPEDIRSITLSAGRRRSPRNFEAA